MKILRKYRSYRNKDFKEMYSLKNVDDIEI